MWKFRSPGSWYTTRDFSNRYFVLEHPQMAACLSRWTSIHLPKREELLFRSVFALPNASRIGL